MCTVTGESGTSHHFFEGETLGLGYKEPDEACAKEREDSEQEISAVGDTLEHVWSDLADATEKVSMPVRRGSLGSKVIRT